jgi:chaperonin GroES
MTGTLIAIQDRVIVIADEAQETTPSGIILPDTAQEKPRTGKVHATGPGRSDTTALLPSMSVKVGDTVYFGKFAGQPIRAGDQEYIVLREDDVLAVIR